MKDNSPLREGIIKRIHVNQHNVKANKKAQNDDLPVITVKTSKENIKGKRVKILGESILVYQPTKPLACGATLWIETYAKVLVK